MKGSLLAALIVMAAGSVHAQDVHTTDPRLYPYLGCWRSDTLGTKTAQVSALTCVVPVAGAQDIDIMSVVDGKVVNRERIESDTRAHAIDGQGCRGQEKTSWSPLGRRVYLRAEYTCESTGITGGSTTLFSFLPTGEWLSVEHVKSGSGSIVRVERRTDVGIPNNLPREIAGRIGAQRLAVVTARAEAATPLRPDDIVETMRNTDTAVARAWLIETAQHFQLTGDQVMSLTRAEVPATVLQAMMSTPPRYQLGVGMNADGHNTDEYLSTPGWGTAYYSAYYAAEPFAATPSTYTSYNHPYTYPSYYCCYPTYYQSYNSSSSYSSSTVNFVNTTPYGYNGYSAYNPNYYYPGNYPGYYPPYSPYYYPGTFSAPLYTYPRFPGQTVFRAPVSRGPVGVRSARP